MWIPLSSSAALVIPFSMKPKIPLLLVTHLLVLGVAYGVASHFTLTAKTAADSTAPARTKSQSRDRQTVSSNGAELLSGFLHEQAEKKSKYEALKASLPVAKNLKGAVVDAIASLDGAGWHAGLTAEEWEDLSAEAEVRVLHWMSQNPAEAMDFLINDPASTETGLVYSLRERVFKEVASENGVLQSMPWLTGNSVTLSTLCSVMLDEMKAGDGLTLFNKVEVALLGNSQEAAMRSAFLDQPRFLGSVGESTPFSDKEKLLELVGRQPDDNRKAALLAGFARSDERASAWLLDLTARGEIEGELANRVKSNLGDIVMHTPSIDLEKRVEARRATEGNENKSREDIINELVRSDVSILLESGRDWRYEFRHGTATAEDVVNAMQIGVPISEGGEDEVRVTLYRQLSEEDPEKALPLLNGLSEEKRREALFEFTWNNQVNVSPDVFLRFMADVPEPVTPQEKDYRTKGWNWKARGFLGRYGDDYVDWVKQMPPGIDKDTAMNSLVWATREQNPAKARELSDELFPKEP